MITYINALSYDKNRLDFIQLNVFTCSNKVYKSEWVAHFQAVSNEVSLSCLLNGHTGQILCYCITQIQKGAFIMPASLRSRQRSAHSISCQFSKKTSSCINNRLGVPVEYQGGEGRFVLTLFLIWEREKGENYLKLPKLLSTLSAWHGGSRLNDRGLVLVGDTSLQQSRAFLDEL